MKRFLFSMVMMLTALAAGAQADSTATVTAAVSQTDSLVTARIMAVPQEKIYIQTDRRYYVAGDTVWFRAHVADAATNIPSTSPVYSKERSKFVYLDLYDNAADTLVERAMIKRDSIGVFANALALPRHLESGSYTLVAYTRWMMNFPEELFAYKEIGIAALPPIGSPYGTDIKAKKDEGKAKADKDDEEENDENGQGDEAQEPFITIAALPEGGNLIAGHWQRLAYKVVDDAGFGVDVEVRLVDTATEEIICEGKSEHKGMGSLYFTPKAGGKYRLEGYAKGGVSCHTAVPATLEKGVTMTVSRRKEMLFITPIIEGVDAKTLSLAIYGNGNMITIDEVTGQPLHVDTSTMRPGVVNVAILNPTTKQVYAERLVFIQPKKHAAVLEP